MDHRVRDGKGKGSPSLPLPLFSLSPCAAMQATLITFICWMGCLCRRIVGEGILGGGGMTKPTQVTHQIEKVCETALYSCGDSSCITESCNYFVVTVTVHCDWMKQEIYAMIDIHAIVQ
jgi:hypothetical protein